MSGLLLVKDLLRVRFWYDERFDSIKGVFLLYCSTLLNPLHIMNIGILWLPLMLQAVKVIFQ